MTKTKEDGQPSGKGNGDGKQETGQRPEEAAQGSQARAELNVLGQYIKDLSFESPAAPGSLQSPPKNPQLQVSVNVGAGQKSGDSYEVTLNLEAHARGDAGVIYNIELSYGGVFQLKNVPEAMLQPVLLIDCPTLLFPFLRARARRRHARRRLPAADARPHRFPPALRAERRPRRGPAKQLTASAGLIRRLLD